MDMERESEMERVVIVDIDHTLSDAFWRDPLLGKWEEYHAAGIQDKPIRFVREIIDMAFAKGKEIVAVTARPEWNRQMTMRWMIQYDIPIDVILMRANDDHRPSTEVKRELVTEAFPDLSVIEFVLEDRDDMVAMYKQMGLNVLQVNYGGRNGGEGPQVAPDVRTTTTETHDGQAEQSGSEHSVGAHQGSGGDPRGAQGDLRPGLSERGS
jgi:5'(3')-deoxyribonucleotidase